MDMWKRGLQKWLNRYQVRGLGKEGYDGESEVQTEETSISGLDRLEVVVELGKSDSFGCRDLGSRKQLSRGTSFSFDPHPTAPQL